ncbi:hypothetical protein [Natronorarus salvus]|uniref:hypothetical protein n=1 Tax=Natronorarus salvus TaxID=3117733 RepID=UPI002F268739
MGGRINGVTPGDRKRVEELLAGVGGREFVRSVEIAEELGLSTRAAGRTVAALAEADSIEEIRIEEWSRGRTGGTTWLVERDGTGSRP